MIEKQENGSYPCPVLMNNGEYTMIKIIILEAKNRGVFGGGDVHMDKLSKIYKEKFGIKINKIFLPFPSMEFNAFSNILSLVKTILVSVDEQYKESFHGAIVVAPNPYPNYLMAALKVSRTVSGYPVIYFHHLSLSLRHIVNRGVLRSLINFSLSLLNLSICKILNLPIFLDNPGSYNLRGFDIFKDEDAPDELIDSETFIHKKEFDLCYIGRFEKHKGAIDIIKVVKVLEKAKRKVRVAIVGNINKKFKLKVLRILKENNVEKNFVFFGTVDNITKLKILSSSSIYLHLSYEEGWGMSVMDAASLGIPIVAYDLPAYSYLNGKFNAVKIGDIEGIVKAIEGVLSNYSAAISIASEAKNLVDKYNYLEIAKYHIESYEKIIEKRKKL